MDASRSLHHSLGSHYIYRYVSFICIVIHNYILYIYHYIFICIVIYNYILYIYHLYVSLYIIIYINVAIYIEHGTELRLFCRANIDDIYIYIDDKLGDRIFTIARKKLSVFVI